MAIAHSPIRRLVDEPSGATGRLRASIFRTARSLVSSMPTSLAGYVVPSFIATEIRVAPATTWAFVTIAPSGRTMNPEPRPAAERWPERPPKNCSKTSAGTRSTTSVCTVTTDGATLATAWVIAVCRDVFTSLVVVSSRDDWAEDGVLDAPWHAARVNALNVRARRILMWRRATSDAERGRSGICRHRGR